MLEKRNHILGNKKTPGQAMIEFALVLPLVLTIVFGIIEIGFLLFTYSSVNSAAREAARYGIAIEDVAGGAQRYYDCDGIVDAGLRIGRFAGMNAGDFAIHYDGGPETANIADSCAALASGDPSVITFGDRIVVEVTHQYRPLVAYMGLNIRPFPMTSTSARTIFKGAEIIAGGGDGVYGGGGGTTECALLSKAVLGGSGQAPAVSPASSAGCDPDNYVAGEALTLTGQPNTGYQTLSWSGVDSVDGSDNNIAYLTFPGATTVGITYVSDTCYTLGNVTFDGTGSNPSYSPAISAVCSTGYAEGETITFTANPASGWGTESWTGATKLNNNTATLSMPAVNGHDVIAHYVECYTVTTSIDSGAAWGGMPQVVTSSDTCSGGTFAAGEVVTIQAYPSVGYQVAAWNGVDSSSGDQAYLTVPAGGAAVSVSYEEEPTLSPPTSLRVPNTFPGDFKWNSSGGGTCTDVKFDFADAMPPNGNWPRLPDYYNVYVTVNGSTTGPYQVTATQWTNGASVGIGYDISFGVEGVFVSSPSAVSMYAQVTYRCLYQSLVYQGSLTRGQ